ncbi:MAG: GDP-L-fucose synthase [Trueperaceae bacterium]|nr:GDP-L-fucose synthase [Trueperaceae bacterium]
MHKHAKIYIAGHRGLVGSALLRKLESEGYTNLLVKTHKELDLRQQDAVQSFFQNEKPDYVFLAAAKVGGILANASHGAQFIYDNLMIAANVIHSAYEAGVTKLLNLGSSCIYPKYAEQPIRETSLLGGVLEPTNQPYALAKIAAIELCDSYRKQYGCDFISAMPTNLFGPNDNFDLQSSHVLPALLRKMLEAQEKNAPSVTLWGTGTPKREFLFVDDMADACLFLMQNFSEPGPINVGTGKDISIRDLAILIKELTGYQGELIFDSSKPDGTPRKLLDVSKLANAGWQASTSLRQGILSTLNWYLSQAELEHA